MFGTENRFVFDPAECCIQAVRTLDKRRDFPLICRIVQYNMLAGGKHELVR